VQPPPILPRAFDTMPWDDYQKVREIFVGAFGRTFLVHRAADQKQLAMKELDFANLDHKERQLALKEAYVLSSLKHPYIIRYCEKFMHNDQLCMLMDGCHEGSLWSFVRLCGRQRAIMPETQVVHWLTQLCLAVKYLHERPQPLLHGDIKTQNIFIVKKDHECLGCVKLLVDFGPMKVLDDPGSLTQGQVGSHFCQSPEICNRLPYGLPSDIWSVGCVLYELCAAHLSWEAADMPQHIENISMGLLSTIFGRYSNELGSIATALFAHDPNQRPTAATVLKTHLLQSEMRKMLDVRHKGDAKGGDGSEDAENAGNRRGRQGSAHGNKPVRPLGEHNFRRPNTARSPSPHEAAKMLLRQNDSKFTPRGPASSRSASPHQELAAMLLLRPSSRAPSPVPGFP